MTCPKCGARAWLRIVDWDEFGPQSIWVCDGCEWSDYEVDDGLPDWSEHEDDFD